MNLVCINDNDRYIDRCQIMDIDDIGITYAINN